MNINARVDQIEVTVNSNIIVVHIVQYGLFMIMLEPDNLTVLCLNSFYFSEFTMSCLH